MPQPPRCAHRDTLYGNISSEKEKEEKKSEIPEKPFSANSYLHNSLNAKNPTPIPNIYMYVVLCTCNMLDLKIHFLHIYLISPAHIAR